MIKRFNEDWDAAGNLGSNVRDEDYWKKYWDKKFADPDAELDTIANYAREHSISYEEAYKEMKGSEKPVNFQEGHTVIGLPSGQVIYMNKEQIAYFRSRNMIMWKNTWKKPTSMGFDPIKLDEYTFEDKSYKTIVDLMKAITWKD